MNRIYREVGQLLNKFKLKLKGKKHDKSGAVSIEMVAVFLIFMMMLGFFFDTFTILNKQYVASKQANILSRQIAVQGGVYDRQPQDYERFGQDFVVTGELIAGTRQKLGGVGIEDFELGVHVPKRYAEGAYLQLQPNNGVKLAYGERFEFKLDFKYEWQVMGQMIPGMGGEKTRTIIRSAVSEYGG